MCEFTSERMDPHRVEIYLSALTHSELSKRALSPEESRFIARMRSQHPDQCRRLDRQVERDLKRKKESSPW
ncbi:hypothetical protein VN12_16680 [Pirellula sp. SH-Sr6A]|nr:hypothetical protein VN12_16680 [Pirellula sp. SH-Sr6A]